MEKKEGATTTALWWKQGGDVLERRTGATEKEDCLGRGDQSFCWLLGFVLSGRVLLREIWRPRWCPFQQQQGAAGRLRSVLRPLADSERFYVEEPLRSSELGVRIEVLIYVFGGEVVLGDRELTGVFESFCEVLSGTDPVASFWEASECLSWEQPRI